MAEQTSTTNRPPLYKVTRGATLKGSQVELLGTPDDKPLDALKPNDRVRVSRFNEVGRVVVHLRRPAFGVDVAVQPDLDAEVGVVHAAHDRVIERRPAIRSLREQG